MDSTTLRSAVLVVCLWCCACQPSAEQARDMLKHYREDAGARDEKMAECKANAGFVREDPSCLIAREALRQESRGSLRNLPPIGLNAEKNTAKDGQGD